MHLQLAPGTHEGWCQLQVCPKEQSRWTAQSRARSKVATTLGATREHNSQSFRLGSLWLGLPPVTCRQRRVSVRVTVSTEHRSRFLSASSSSNRRPFFHLHTHPHLCLAAPQAPTMEMQTRIGRPRIEACQFCKGITCFCLKSISHPLSVHLSLILVADPHHLYHLDCAGFARGLFRSHLPV